MPLPQWIDPISTDYCSLVDRWKIHPELAQRLVQLSGFLPFRIGVMSGYRTAEHQATYVRAGNGARDDLSTHRSCPATGADLATHDDSWETRVTLGRMAETLGLRWGGGAPRQNGVPIGVEWRHVDLGPRRT